MRHPRFCTVGIAPVLCHSWIDCPMFTGKYLRLQENNNNNNNNNGCVQSDMKIYLHVPLDVPSTENTSGRDGRQQRKYLHKRKGQTKSYIQKERELVDRKRKQSACWGCHQAVSLGVERRRD